MEDPGTAYSGIDNLSRLPDELLSQILSLLCTEDAIRTSVLSTRWRYLYTSISSIDFDFSIYNHKLFFVDEQECMDFLDRFLFYRKKCAIDKFKLTWKMSQALDPLRLETWIKAVLWHGIRELDLCIYDLELKDLLLPSSLFTCKALAVLKLNIRKYMGTISDVRNYEFELPARVCLPSLKSIHLRNVSFSEDSWSRLFTNCPILEEFFFKFERGYCKLSVSSPILKRLTIEQQCGFFDVFVDAPSLVYLRFVSEVQSLKLVNVRSLVEANIEVHSDVEDRRLSRFNVCSELMRGISCIQMLRMCTTTLKITSTFLSQFLKYSAVPIPVLHNMTRLTIYDSDYKYVLDLASLPYLLEKCESLETLVLKDRCIWHTNKWNRVEESRISCLTSVLKTIKVGEFVGKKREIEMVKYFLKTARVLELIKIRLSFACEDPSETAKELQMLPKCSEAFMDIIF